MHDPELVAHAGRFRPWDAMSPAALTGILKRGPFECTAETGCGGSTIVLSHASRKHIAFALEGEDFTISGLRNCPDFHSESVEFVEGRTAATLPTHFFESEMDLVLLDGPHAYPWPQVEFAYLFPRLKNGGWLVLDDIQIPSVHQLFRFLTQESSVALEEVALRTAFFRRVKAPDEGPDGWDQQGMNRHPILRYSWRDTLRRFLRSR